MGIFFSNFRALIFSGHFILNLHATSFGVLGLRKAKVPLMVYSCGGFSRCFRIARFYDLEGPPVGVEYSKPGEDDRRALNPEF